MLPVRVEDLEDLPGIGPYIARAIASLAHGTPVIALEANGLRVAARWTRDRGDLRTGAVRARLANALAAAMPVGTSAAFNEAVMELGETICRPVPQCDRCPVSAFCRGFQETEDPGSLPFRPPRKRRPHVRAAVVVLRERGRWLVQRRPPTGLLGGLWEFPGGKIEAGEGPGAAALRELREETGFDARGLRYCGIVRHAYSHFSVELHVFEGLRAGRSRSRSPGPDQRWVTASELGRLPLPKATEKVVRLLERRRTASLG